MFTLTESQIDSLQCFASGLLSVTDIALRLKDADINIVAMTDNLDSEMLYLLQSGEKESQHVHNRGMGGGQYLLQLNRPNEHDDYDEMVVLLSVAPSDFSM